MRILMATDGSRRSVQALATAGRMLAGGERVVELLYVSPDVRKHPNRQRFEDRAHRLVARVKDALAESGVPVRTIVKVGSAARVLIGSSQNYDLTVIAAASRRTGPMVGLGPVASRVAEHASSSVLVARDTRGESALRVLAPVDGSEASFRALDKLVACIDLTVAEVTLMHVAETPWLHPGDDQEWLGDKDPQEERDDPQVQLQRELLAEGESILEAARDRLPAGVSVNTQVVEGLPAEEILSEADQGYDLVVLGASGAADLKHQILGSVSSKVAWHAPCSVLLVRSGE